MTGEHPSPAITGEAMRYRNIDAMAHNFGHSFVSLMNVVGHTHVVDEIARLTRQLDAPLEIDFLSGAIRPAAARTPILATSVRHYRDWLPTHAANHGITIAAIRSFDLRIAPTAGGWRVVALVHDDRSVTHTVPIRQTAL